MPGNKHIFAAFVLITLAAYHQTAPRISVEGSRITIDSGSHRLEGTLEPESTYQFLRMISSFLKRGRAFILASRIRASECVRISC